MSENEKTQVGDIDRSMYDFRYEETEDSDIAVFIYFAVVIMICILV